MLIECTKKLVDAMKTVRFKGGALQKAEKYCIICNRGDIPCRGFYCRQGQKLYRTLWRHSLY